MNFAKDTSLCDLFIDSLYMIYSTREASRLTYIYI